MLSADAHTEGNCFEFGEALNSTFEQITNVLQKIGSSSSDRSLPEESVGNITSWKFLFESFVADLRLDLLCDKLLETIFCEVSYFLLSLIYCLARSAFKFVIW